MPAALGEKRKHGGGRFLDRAARDIDRCPTAHARRDCLLFSRAGALGPVQVAGYSFAGGPVSGPGGGEDFPGGGGREFWVFVSRDLDLWAYQRGVTLDFSPPGKPTDNAFIESFNGKFRAECLNAHGFLSVRFVRKWGLGADNVRLVHFVRARISAENAQYGAASAGCGAYSGSNLPVSGPAVADAFCPRADGDWNSIFGSGAPIRQCLSDAALFQLTLERKGHRNRRTGDCRGDETIRRRRNLCLFRAVVGCSNSRGMAINPDATSTIVRGYAKVPQWVAQTKRSAPPDRFITTIAAATAPRTRRRSC